MSRILLALLSFIVGASSALLFPFLTHTPAEAQETGKEPPKAISMPGAEPVVPPLRVHLHGGGVRGFAVQSLDGLDCDGCELSVGKLTYAGGAFQLTNARVPNNIDIELRGAASNTVNLLRALGALPAPPPTAQDKNIPPKKKTPLEVKPQSSFTLVSLEGIEPTGTK